LHSPFIETFFWASELENYFPTFQSYELQINHAIKNIHKGWLELF
jgi:hypothetical protein